MGKLCIINVVGLTPNLMRHAPRLSQLGSATPLRPPIPAVTMTSQATLLTGLPPSQHGIVGNGWYYRDTCEIRFWQQANSLVQGSKFYEGIRTAKMFWWFNQGSGCKWSVTPKPHYGSDGSKEFDVIDATGCDLVQQLGPFPFHAFWGPMAGLASTEWIAKSTAIVMRQQQPELTLVYLPHLDYDYQRYSAQSPERVAEVDRCAGEVIDAAHDIGAEVIVVSEYGLVPVERPVMINQELRRAGWLTVRDGPFGEMLMPVDSRVFAVADHQVAHVYVRDVPLDDVRSRLEAIPGVARVVAPEELDLHHSRSGELIALSEPDAWFAYYYWLDHARAPDFATSVDIHRKPGYDPCELFMTSKLRAAGRLLQKKLGFRYRMDVVPLEPRLVRGSHGLLNEPDDGAMIIGPNDPPSDMQEFSRYVRDLI